MRVILAVLTLLGSQNLRAETQPPLETMSFAALLGAPVPVFIPNSVDVDVSVRHTSISNMGANTALFSSRDYQLGDEWGKKPVTAASAARESAAFQRAAKATARLGGATAFYLGVFNGHHMMATNHHVVEGMSCAGSRASFPLLGKAFACEKIYGDWNDIDLALFSIRVGPGEEAALAGVGANFAFDAAVYPGQRLLTIGFGVANNPGGVMMSNQDSDCRTFSGRGDFRKMADPDDFNPGPDKVWSFASGCDISHGDSGSAYVDRDTGEVVGIVWTGRIPKSPQVSSSRYLQEMQRTQSAEIWTELSYTVPAASIRDGLNDALASGTLSADEEATLKAVVGPSGAPVAIR